ncbi:hypothetical protein GCM10010182_09050 [Actinomadura cremea]|nr:hypothetical protein GCM10010182_09050 [Actinomadura cremea]
MRKPVTTTATRQRAAATRSAIPAGPGTGSPEFAITNAVPNPEPTNKPSNWGDIRMIICPDSVRPEIAPAGLRGEGEAAEEDVAGGRARR